MVPPLAAIALLLLLLIYGNVRIEKQVTSLTYYNLRLETSARAYSIVEDEDIRLYAQSGSSVISGPLFTNTAERPIQLSISFEGDLGDRGLVKTPYSTMMVGANQSRIIQVNATLPLNSSCVITGRMKVESRYYS